MEYDTRSMSPIGLVCMDMPDDCTARLVDAAGIEVDALNTGELLGLPTGAHRCPPASAAHACGRGMSSRAWRRLHTLHVTLRLPLPACALQTARQRLRWRCSVRTASCTSASNGTT